MDNSSVFVTHAHRKYRLQYQPRRAPGDATPRTIPQIGNDKWATAEDNITASKALGKLRGLGLILGRKTQEISSALMDDTYFYRVVPVEVDLEKAPPIPVAALMERL